MQEKLLEILECPKCHGTLNCSRETIENEEIIAGRLSCQGCSEIYPIENGIPRFVERGNYASSFGYQWNIFKREQLDSYNGTTLSADRLYSETGWSKDWLKGKLILDAGCGAGRFLDVVSQTEAEVVGIDISTAIDAAKDSLADRKNLHFVQASIYDLPFRHEVFDGCYCIGVVQHTPEPSATFPSLFRVLKQGGKFATSIYERKPWQLLYSKYWYRPFTKKMSKEKLLGAIQKIMPVAFPVTNVLFRIPVLGRLFWHAIPVANYVHEKALTSEQRYNWAVLDTFDMLSPQYDQPQTQAEVEQSLKQSGAVEIKRLKTAGLNIIGQKGTTKAN
ncbi:MAG: methyltransferase domain-containing protein [Acidobacteriota bacterium]|nr:methyltransferase domain-containing protein [Acidobacteriota bacterium]